MNKKTVIITGSSSGIGLSLVNKFISEGWIVIATLRNPSSTNFPTHENLLIRKLDLTISETIDDVISEVVNRFGKIDLIINNAGFGLMGFLENTSLNDIKKQFDVNLFGAVSLTKKALPQMRKQNDGHIIFLSSIVGRLGFPGFSPYTSSKFALEGFVESLHYEVKEFKIILNLVLPGSVKTKFWSNRQISNNTIQDYNELQNKLVNWKGGFIKTTSDLVAKRIYRIAKKRKRKLRNYITLDSKLLAILKRLLPDSWVFYLIRKFFKKK